jgi:hypothetical protein
MALLFLTYTTFLQGSHSSVHSNLSNPFNISFESSPSSPSTHSQSEHIPTLSPESRSLLTSCITLILSVVALAIRPNMPAPNESTVSRLWRHAKLVVLGVLAPEFLAYYAVMQRLYAERIVTFPEGMSSYSTFTSSSAERAANNLQQRNNWDGRSSTASSHAWADSCSSNLPSRQPHPQSTTLTPNRTPHCTTTPTSFTLSSHIGVK